MYTYTKSHTSTKSNTIIYYKHTYHSVQFGFQFCVVAVEFTKLWTDGIFWVDGRDDEWFYWKSLNVPIDTLAFHGFTHFTDVPFLLSRVTEANPRIFWEPGYACIYLTGHVWHFGSSCEFELLALCEYP